MVDRPPADRPPADLPPDTADKRAPEVATAIATALATLAAERPEAASRVGRLAERPVATAELVVVGAAKVGKSTLVNAVVGAGELAPVAPVAASSVPLRLSHAPDRSASLWLGGAAAPIAVEPDRIADHVLAPGSELAVPPRLVESRAPEPFLCDLTVVDGPGATAAGHGPDTIALAAAEQPAAVLLVSSAEAPLSAAELASLERARAVAGVVIVALTRVDQFRGWRAVAEADRELLRRRDPRWAAVPVVPVAPALELRAAVAERGGDPRAARALRQVAPVEPLRQLLRRDVAGRSTQLRAVALLRVAQGELESVARDQLRQGQVLAGAGSGRREERERLVALRRSGGRIWQLRLHGAVRRARLECSEQLRRELRELTSRLRATIDSAERGGLAAFPAEVDAALRILSRDQLEQALCRLRAITDTTLDEVFGADAAADAYSAFARSPVLDPAVAPPPRVRDRTEERIVAIGGVMAGFGAGRLVALVPLVAGAGPVVAAAAVPVSVGLGLAASAWMIRGRQHAADRERLRRWLQETLGEARAAIEAELAAQFVDAEQALALALGEAIDARVVELERQIAEVDRAARRDAAQRERERSALAARVAEVTRARRRVAAALRLLGADATTATGAPAVASSAAAALPERLVDHDRGCGGDVEGVGDTAHRDAQ